ncbi:hypothetical protein [Candidatus Villigracilis affinis]|uniref:hypothetical protein n=1 Tax=Candidatus Villigracilis affinis TaxID=3140682 RepID=UPI002A1A2427|nr:hypothetical protein [Anaerolineales bacterium]
MINWLSKNRQTVARGFGSVLALVLLAVLIQEQGDGELFSAFRRVSPGYFGLALVVLLVSRLFAILRWHILLRQRV